jgi:hypothetical protein
VLDREIEALRGEVAALTERYNAVSLESLAGAPPIRIVEPASPPLARHSPHVLTNTFMGFLAGCALAGLFLLLGPRRGVGFAAKAEKKPLPFSGRTYRGTLRRPQGQRSFTAEESREIRSRLGDLLAGPLADPRRALYVLSAERDSDAVAVYNLLAAFLKSRGEDVNAEGSEEDGGQLVRTRSRALIYCGGLAESGEIPPPAREDEELVLVVGGRTGRTALEALHSRLEEAGWAEPFLIRLDR